MTGQSIASSEARGQEAMTGQPLEVIGGQVIRSWPLDSLEAIGGPVIASWLLALLEVIGGKAIAS